MSSVDEQRILNNIKKLNSRISKYERFIVACKREILNQNKLLFMLQYNPSNHSLDMKKVISDANAKCGDKE